MHLRAATAAVATGMLVAVTAAAPVAAQEDGITVTSAVIESFDGTGIYSTLFVPPGVDADDPAPIVFRGHGWGGRGERAVSEGSTLDVLLDAGYVVLTWDERGFGDTGDVAHVMSPEFERKDIQVLLDHAASLEMVQLDGPGDPRVGMTGGSYGGAYQLVTAAVDDRIDALAPEITWSDLRYSLADGGVPKFGWGHLLFNFGLVGATRDGLDPRFNSVETGNYERELYEIYARANLLNTLDDPARDYYAARSIVEYGEVDPVEVPSLVMQGHVDTLFNMNESTRIVEHLRAAGTPVKHIAFCGGHVSCPESYADAGDRDHLDQAILTWFQRYLRDDTTVDTGAPFEYRTNEGVWRKAADYPPPGSRSLPVTGEATLVSVPLPDTAGAALTAQPNEPGDPRGAAFEVVTAEGGPLELVGIPRITLDVTGSGRTAHLFAKLVDREAGEVLNVQEGAVRVTDLSSDAQTFTFDLPGVVYTLAEGHTLELQVSTTSLLHSVAREPAQVTVTVDAEVPVLRTAPVSRGATPTPAG